MKHNLDSCHSKDNSQKSRIWFLPYRYQKASKLDSKEEITYPSKIWLLEIAYKCNRRPLAHLVKHLENLFVHRLLEQTFRLKFKNLGELLLIQPLTLFWFHLECDDFCCFVVHSGRTNNWKPLQWNRKGSSQSLYEYKIMDYLNHHLQFFWIFFDQRIKPSIIGLNFHVWHKDFILSDIELINGCADSRHDDRENLELW